MSLVNPPAKTITAEELMAMPDDGIHREIIRGELREWPGEFLSQGLKGRPMTMRNRVHSEIEANVAHLLRNWLIQQPTPRGKVHSGEVGFRLRRDPETLVGIDVAYVSAELVTTTDPKYAFYDGNPVLAVEILSPSDKIGEIADKVAAYLDAGTVVWVIDSDFHTIRVHKPGRVIELFNETQDISGEPELHGLRVRVAELSSDPGDFANLSKCQEAATMAPP